MKLAVFLTFLFLTRVSLVADYLDIDQDTLIKRSGIYITDSLWGSPGKDYEADEVLIIIDRQKYALEEILGPYWGKRHAFKDIPYNTLLEDLGILNPVCSYVRDLNLVIVKTTPGQSVIDLIKEQQANPYIKIIQPNYIININ